METLIVVLVLAALVSWILAELHGGRVARFVTGGAVILAAYFVGQFVASVIPSYERTATRASMRRLTELLERGQVEDVRNAVQTYNTEAMRGSTYTAVQKMWETVSREPEDSKQP